MTATFTTPTIETERLVLRKPKADDISALTEFHVSERSRYAGDPVHRARALMDTDSIFGHWQVCGYGPWTVTAKGDDTTLGMFGPFYPDGRPENEIGWVLFASAESKGIAFESAQAAFPHAGNALSRTDIANHIDAANECSIALAERLDATVDATAEQPKPDNPCLVFHYPKSGMTPERTGRWPTQ